MLSPVGNRYARALLDLVLSPGSTVSTVAAAAQIHEMAHMAATSPELTAVLLNPAVPESQKRGVIEKLAAAAGWPQLIKNFLFVVVDHKRVAQLEDIRRSFEHLADERLGFARATILSAAPLEPGEIERLSSELSRLSGKMIRPDVDVDPSLLGGVVARVGSTVYDGSLRGQLEQMRRQFTREAAENKTEV